MQSTAKARAISWIINRIMDVANRKVNIRDLQKKYRAEEGRILEMNIVDIRKKYYLRVLEGRLEYLENIKADDIAGGFETNSATLIDLAIGTRKRMNPANGDIYPQVFTPFDALTHGEIRIWGDAASNDALLFAKAVHEDVYPHIQKEIRETSRHGRQAK